MSRPTREERMSTYTQALKVLAVDADTGVVTWKPGACRRGWEGREAGTEVSGRRKVWVSNAWVAVSNLVWYVKTGQVPPVGVRHMNGNDLDDRFENLRLATRDRAKAPKLSQVALRERFDYIGSGLYYRYDIGKARAGDRAGTASADPDYDYSTRVVKFGGRYYRESHLVWLYHTGSLPEDQLDHKNGNPLDNRIENLRQCSKAENQQNRRLSRDNTSGLLGAWPTPSGRWGSAIQVSGKVLNLGCFDTAEAAHSAYLAAKAKHHKFNPIPREASRALPIY